MIRAILIAAVVILAGWGAYEIAGRRRRRQDDGPAYLPAPAGPPAAPAAQPRLDYDAQAWETVARLAAQAEAEAEAARAAQDRPAAPPAEEPVPWSLLPPPPMPYRGDLSRAMVHQIDYPDPADLSPDKDRAYRNMLRRVGVATGTHTSLEDTCTWALPALEPGDGTGVPL